MIGASLLGLAALFATTGTANAAPSACRTSTKSFDIPNNLDPTVHIELCVRQDDADVIATAHVEWNRGSIGTVGQAFDTFDFDLRLERDDVTQSRAACNVKDRINDQKNGDHYCYTSWKRKGSAKTWSADGTVKYNINNDGKGDYTWQLTGTPRI
ncbi:hypothetical protein GCM10022243_46010 [Saccharothrix violaceirubra]